MIGVADRWKSLPRWAKWLVLPAVVVLLVVAARGLWRRVIPPTRFPVPGLRPHRTAAEVEQERQELKEQHVKDQVHSDTARAERHDDWVDWVREAREKADDSTDGDAG